MIPSNGLKTSTPAQLPEWANLIITGQPGAAKTTLLGLAGKGQKILIADPEGGTVSFQNAFFKNHEDAVDLNDIRIVDFDGVSTAQEVIRRVESILDYLIRTKNSDGYALFALDSLTELQARFLSLHQAPDPRQSYGALQDALYTLVHKARQAPLHTVFTTRVRAEVDPISQREVIRPDASPGVWKVVGGLFDQIGLLDVKAQGVRTTRTLDFGFRPRFQGKDRYGLGEITDPTFVKILAGISATRHAMAGDTPAVVPPRRPVRPAATAARR